MARTPLIVNAESFYGGSPRLDASTATTGCKGWVSASSGCATMTVAQCRGGVLRDQHRGDQMNASTKAGLFCGMVALAVLGIEAWGADSTKADPAKDVAAMHAVDQAWVQAYNSNDADGIANLYDENALLLPPGAPAMKGRNGIKQFLGND